MGLQAFVFLDCAQGIKTWESCQSHRRQSQPPSHRIMIQKLYIDIHLYFGAAEILDQGCLVGAGGACKGRQVGPLLTPVTNDLELLLSYIYIVDWV